MKCPLCYKLFASKSSLSRHKKESCPFRFDVVSSSKRRRVGSSNDPTPSTSGSNGQPTLDHNADNQSDRVGGRRCEANASSTSVTDQGADNQRRRKRRLEATGTAVAPGVEKVASAFKSRICTYRFTTNEEVKLDCDAFFQGVKEKVIAIIKQYRTEYQALKVNCELFGIYSKPEKQTTDIKSFNTKNKIIVISTALDEIYEEFKTEIVNKCGTFEEKESGWLLMSLLYLEVNINQYNPLRAGSFIKLPKQIEYKRAVLNIQNKDQCCFAHSIVAALIPPMGHPCRSTSYPHFSSLLNFDGIDFPVQLKDIPRFEKQNNISINVFGLEYEYKTNIWKVVGPLYFTSGRRATHVNLLLLTENGEHHYCLIKDMSRLISRQRSRHVGRIYICDGCLQCYDAMEKLKRHQTYDCNHVTTKLPTTNMSLNKYGEYIPKNKLKFTNLEKQLKVPFVVYADFESMLKPIQYAEPNSEDSFSVKTFEHVPFSFCFYIKCSFDDSVSQIVQYRGLDAAEKFVEKLEEHVVRLYHTYLKQPKEMLPLTPQEEDEFKKSTVCHVCEKEFQEADIKVRDHCHLTGKYRFAAHSVCNLNYKLPRFVPVFLHNLSNYDSHLFIKKLALDKEKVDVIAQNKEKYISFSKRILVEQGNEKEDNVFMKLRFLDSYRFLPSALDKLSETLASEECCEIKKFFSNQDEFNEIRKKGIFPYSYVDSWEKLSVTSLPSRAEFFDILRGENITTEEYNRACYVWKLFKCETLGDYSDVYIKSDVLLLADVFERFRIVSLTTYKLDPAQYFTAPSLAWDAMLRKTKVELDLLTDVDMLHFFRKAIRGGLSQCSQRAAEANNKFISDYDETKPSSYVVYLDATNLYGKAMSQCLPTGGFKWLTEGEIESCKWSTADENSKKGYILEVDLLYPKHLHDLHNDLPFCPETAVPPKGKHKKLLATLKNKTKYVIHYRNLQQCLQHGLQLKKIHRILEFDQSPWLKSYIDLNTILRNKASSKFEKDLFKLFNNAVFGKTMENPDKRVDIRLCTHWESTQGSVGAQDLISKPNFKSVSIFSENLVAVQMSPIEITYDKPLFVGFTVLEIAKNIMYSFYYDYIKAKYGDDAVLCYTDTDSLVMHIRTDNFYDDMRSNINYFDTSNFPENNIHGITKTPSVVGKMKDEYAGAPIHKFYGLGAKTYCIKLQDGDIKKAKGVRNSAIKELTVADYKHIVKEGGNLYKKMFVFKSCLHTIYTELKNKVALTSVDDKRYFVPGSIHTMAWGHHAIPVMERYRQIENQIEFGDMLDTLVQPKSNDKQEDKEEDEEEEEFYIAEFDLKLL